MRVKAIIIVVGIMAALAVAGFSMAPDIMDRLKARGYLRYTIAEAQGLAYKKCIQCHTVDNIIKYCFRCGPPMVVVAHNMRKLIEIEKAGAKPSLESYTDAEAIAITEVWNALIGNWEKDWRKDDMIKLLENDRALIEFLDVPMDRRLIETALSSKSLPGAHKLTVTPMTPLKE
ncbi:MAG: hypothetical protein HY880_04930 [Deltaproteobacteria bacterium]|nr:hypothetical protein [Deltaproteobacteria bacterium]